MEAFQRKYIKRLLGEAIMQKELHVRPVNMVGNICERGHWRLRSLRCRDYYERTVLPKVVLERIFLVADRANQE